MDGDEIPNFRDDDSDGDKILDIIETAVDTDKDGTADFEDLDSDNDGYSDADERGISSLEQAPLDTDKDGLADYVDTDTDGDGILDKDEDDTNLGNLPDCDKDGISNRLDKDLCDLLKPRGISPNGDGKNDYLIIPGILRYQPNHLMIYNRWGNLVFKSDNYLNDWNGIANRGTILYGEELPEGTYFYLIRIEGESETRKGYLTLWR